MKAAMCLETSKDQSILFIGGCDNMDIQEGHPLITAVRFDGSLEHMDSLSLGDTSMRNVFQLKRLGNTDVLVAGGFYSISLVQFNRETGKFFELKQLSNLHNGEIFDFVIQGHEIYSICSSDKYIHRF